MTYMTLVAMGNLSFKGIPPSHPLTDSFCQQFLTEILTLIGGGVPPLPLCGWVYGFHDSGF